MSDWVTPAAETLPWYKDPVKLRQKREEPRVSRERQAKIVGKHPSYIEEIESRRIALMWEENGELIWSNLMSCSRAKSGGYPESSKRLPASVPTPISWTKSSNCTRSGKLSNK